MAEILIKAVDATHPDPAKDRGCYKRGMPVDVFEDYRLVDSSGNFMFKEARPPKFFIVRVPDMTVEEAKQYLAPEISPINGSMYRRRKWGVDVDVPALKKLLSAGFIAINRTQFLTFMRLLGGD